MSELGTVFSGAFSVLSAEVYGIPLYGWLVITGLISMIGLFIRGKK